MHERLIRRQETMPSGEQVPFQHSFHCVLAEHLDHAAVGSQFGSIEILGKVFSYPELLTYLIDVLELVGRILVRAKDAETVHVRFHHVAKEGTQRPRVLRLNLPRLAHLDTIRSKVRKA